ncbi:MAG: hypothetical protein HONBIEJF_00254 [Fimbriimonadaceae bacterium]|nr:hypothetical protein [Fimbriimonadaceae bacterium]
MVRVFLAAIALMSLGACSAPKDGAESPSSRSVVLRLKGNPGDSYGYKVDLNLELKVENEEKGTPKGPHTMKLAADFVSKLEKTEGDVTHWTITNEKSMASGTGLLERQAVEIAKNQSNRVVKKSYDALGRPSGPNASVDDNPFEVSYPEGAVKPGSVWSGKIRFNGIDVVTNYRLVKFDKVDGTDAAQIDIQFVGSETAKVLEPLELWVDVATGRPLKGHGKIQTQLQPGVNLISVVEMSRVS